jgi:ketosteroid isomerase-like protein
MEGKIMKEEEARKLYEGYYGALKAKPFDMEKLVSFWAEDIRYEDVSAQAVCNSKAEGKAWFEKWWAAWPHNILEVINLFVSGDRLACEWIWTIPEESLTSEEAKAAGVHVAKTGDLKIKGVSIQELNAEGKIQGNRDYYDITAISQHLGMPTEEWIEKLGV